MLVRNDIINLGVIKLDKNFKRKIEKSYKIKN